MTTAELRYERVLQEYCQTGSEDALYRASLLSQEFVAAGIPPDEIVALHSLAVEKVVRPNDARGLVASQQMLLEVMIAYGVRYNEYADMRVAEADRNAQVEQARAEAAEQAEQDRMELLASISHELGTPLTVVKGNIGALRRFLAAHEHLASEIMAQTVDVELATDRMLSLREDLIAAGRQGERELELEPVQLGHLVERAVRWATTTAADKEITISSNVTATSPFILGDTDALQSIFGNLLSNAVRYTPRGGTVEVTCEQNAAEVRVTVADSGIGFGPEVGERLFERFYRAPEAKKMASFGLGLGLSLTKVLVEALRGTISAASAPGGGATFTVTFPLMTLGDDQ